MRKERLQLRKNTRMEEVKLHGFWYSPFTMRVVWTLKIKGIPYANIEEDRFNKSPQLLQYNPVHKKTPVLVHAGRPLCESMIIVEYIDGLCPQNPLVPADPYERAQGRFWVNYADQMMPEVAGIFRARDGEQLGKAIEKVWEHFKVIEEHCLVDQRKLFGGDTINFVDLAFGSIFKFVETMEDVQEVKILVAEKFPHLHSWYENFKNAPVIKENLPDREKMLAVMKFIREKMLGSS